MFDLPMGVGRVHALIQTSFEEGAAAKTVAESRFDVSAFPIPPLRLSASARVLPIRIRRAALALQRVGSAPLFDITPTMARPFVGSGFADKTCPLRPSLPAPRPISNSFSEN